jgi:head-tail joining protein
MTLSAAELAYMQSVQNDFLPDLCTRRRVTNTDDGYGGTTQTNSDVANVPCRAWNTTTRAVDQAAGAERNVWPYTFTFRWNQDVLVKDQILYGGYTYEVRSINEPDSWMTALRIGAERLD